MGRPERHIDPDAGPVEAFAAELRDLREAAGRPKYAALAQRTGKSQTALAEAAGGRRLPTWETVAAYVEGCQGDLRHWRQRWLAATDLVAPERLAEAGAPLPPPDRLPVRRRWLLLAGTLAALGVLWLVAVWPARFWPAEKPPVEMAVADEADPKDSGCAADPGVYSLDNVEITYDRRPLGVVELRYSPRCGVAWPRFTPLGTGPMTASTVIHVDAIRPGDGRRATFDMPYAGTSVFGNVLHSTRECVYAEVRVVLAPGRVPAARTACFRGRVRVDTGPAPR